MDHFDCLYAEVGGAREDHGHLAHPYLSGVPHRIAHVERTFEDMLGQDGVVAWDGEQILDWYLAARVATQRS